MFKPNQTKRGSKSKNRAPGTKGTGHNPGFEISPRTNMSWQPPSTEQLDALRGMDPAHVAMLAGAGLHAVLSVVGWQPKNSIVSSPGLAARPAGARSRFPCPACFTAWTDLAAPALHVSPHGLMPGPAGVVAARAAPTLGKRQTAGAQGVPVDHTPKRLKCDICPEHDGFDTAAARSTHQRRNALHLARLAQQGQAQPATSTRGANMQMKNTARLGRSNDGSFHRPNMKQPSPATPATPAAPSALDPSNSSGAQAPATGTTLLLPADVSFHRPANKQPSPATPATPAAPPRPASNLNHELSRASTAAPTTPSTAAPTAAPTTSQVRDICCSGSVSCVGVVFTSVLPAAVCARHTRCSCWCAQWRACCVSHQRLDRAGFAPDP